jgi:hypothetical protein
MVLTLVRSQVATLAARTARKKRTVSNYTIQVNCMEVLDYTTETDVYVQIVSVPSLWR